MKKTVILAVSVMALAALLFVFGDAAAANAMPWHPGPGPMYCTPPRWHGGYWVPGAWHPGWFDWRGWHPGWFSPPWWHAGWWEPGHCFPRRW
ncbi:hypothetical protein P0W64_01000 [Tsukamurella sp. 8F]|uniref:hypothetical protein n=1 Tax=unclassified Tsukamurella TaxID=2633480 RepID=UPI0023B8A9DA|nr:MULTISPECIES: hypothetical protein [unclassified Tsukamurella]MDF0529163.1 hypothetical protein [Tsukamurella sp. 8J]MDF0585348.1 hypothetical protein [Tsukamurella sp. 8F]